jgi:tetratricopeptide (TPR) repeat protein
VRPSLTMLLLAVVSLAACSKPDPSAQARQAGNVLFKKGEFEKAGAEYEEAIGLEAPPQAKSYETAAFAYLKAGNLTKATELLVKALELKPDTASKLETYRNITGMYLQANRGAEAEKYFQAILTLAPKDAAAMGWLAEIASDRGGARNQLKPAVVSELERALEWYAKVLEVTPDDVGPWVNRRIIYVKLADAYAGQKAQAEADAEANKQDPETARDFTQQAADAQAKLDDVQRRLAEANQKIGALNRAKATAGKQEPDRERTPP